MSLRSTYRIIRIVVITTIFLYLLNVLGFLGVPNKWDGSDRGWSESRDDKDVGLARVQHGVSGEEEVGAGHVRGNDDDNEDTSPDVEDVAGGAEEMDSQGPTCSVWDHVVKYTKHSYLEAVRTGKHMGVVGFNMYAGATEAEQISNIHAEYLEVIAHWRAEVNRGEKRFFYRFNYDGPCGDLEDDVKEWLDSKNNTFVEPNPTAYAVRNVWESRCKNPLMRKHMLERLGRPKDAAEVVDQVTAKDTDHFQWRSKGDKTRKQEGRPIITQRKGRRLPLGTHKFTQSHMYTTELPDLYQVAVPTAEELIRYNIGPRPPQDYFDAILGKPSAFPPPDGFRKTGISLSEIQKKVKFNTKLKKKSFLVNHVACVRLNEPQPEKGALGYYFYPLLRVMTASGALSPQNTANGSVLLQNGDCQIKDSVGIPQMKKARHIYGNGRKLPGKRAFEADAFPFVDPVAPLNPARFGGAEVESLDRPDNQFVPFPTSHMAQWTYCESTPFMDLDFSKVMWRGAATGCTSYYSSHSKYKKFHHTSTSVKGSNPEVGRKSLMLRWGQLTSLTGKLGKSNISVDPIFGRVSPNAPSKYLDVALINHAQRNRGPWRRKKSVSVDEMRTYAVGMVVEGNDIASNNLRIMMDTKVLYMVEQPFSENSLFQGMLKPWIHYVPISPDYNDLEIKFLWCVRHKRECEDIAHRGSMYAHAVYYGTELSNIVNKATCQIYMKRWGAILDRVCDCA